MTAPDWTELLKPKNGGPGDSPGREEAIDKTLKVIAERYARDGKKRAKGSNSRKVVKESRQATDARRARFPSLKHGAD